MFDEFVASRLEEVERMMVVREHVVTRSMADLLAAEVAEEQLEKLDQRLGWQLAWPDSARLHLCLWMVESLGEVVGQVSEMEQLLAVEVPLMVGVEVPLGEVVQRMEVVVQRTEVVAQRMEVVELEV